MTPHEKENLIQSAKYQEKLTFPHFFEGLPQTTMSPSPLCPRQKPTHELLRWDGCTSTVTEAELLCSHSGSVTFNNHGNTFQGYFQHSAPGVQQGFNSMWFSCCKNHHSFTISLRVSHSYYQGSLSVPMTIKGVICKKWPPVEFMLQTNRSRLP